MVDSLSNFLGEAIAFVAHNNEPMLVQFLLIEIIAIKQCTVDRAIVRKGVDERWQISIINLLKNGRLSAGEICEHFPVTGASISRHLSVLKEADLIRDKREGKFIYYELNASVLEEIMLWITDLKGASDNEGNDTEK